VFAILLLSVAVAAVSATDAIGLEAFHAIESGRKSAGCEQQPSKNQFFSTFSSSKKRFFFPFSHIAFTCMLARETPALCFHTPQNPFANEGGLQWMCKNENLCMACAPTRASTVNDGFDHFRAQYKCQLDECKTYLPYLLCPAAACRIV